LVGEFHLNSKSPIADKNGEKQKFTTTKIPLSEKWLLGKFFSSSQQYIYSILISYILLAGWL
jgi:hypothetical protein